MRLRFFTSGLSSLVMASLLWAFSFGLIRTYLTGLNPHLIAWLRLTLSCILFAPLFRRRGADGILLLKLLGIGAIQYGVMYVAYIQSYQYLRGHEVALFTIFTPIYIALLYAIARREWPWRVLVSGSFGVLGAAVVVYRTPDRAVALRGVLLLQLANVAFAFGQVAYRRIMQDSQIRFRDRDLFAILFAGGMLLTALVCSLSGAWHTWDLNRTQLLVVLYLGLIPSGVGFFLWNRGARLVNHGTLAVMNNLKIPLAVLATIILFHEQADLVRLIVGGSVIVGAVWMCERRGA